MLRSLQSLRVNDQRNEVRETKGESREACKTSEERHDRTVATREAAGPRKLRQVVRILGLEVRLNGHEI